MGMGLVGWDAVTRITDALLARLASEGLEWKEDKVRVFLPRL